MRVIAAWGLMLCASTSLVAQGMSAQNGAALTFHFERPGLPVPVYTISIHGDGSGTYAATYLAAVSAPSRYAAADAATSAPAPAADETVGLTISAATAAKLFERARAVGYFHAGCESRAKHIADSGAKTLAYSGPEGAGHCTYNYTENKAIIWLTETFQGIAVTMDYGRSLAIKHRYDHLGLDAQVAELADSVKDGRALEVGAIGPVLRAIADDPQLLDRVRARAAQLLASAK